MFPVPLLPFLLLLLLLLAPGSPAAGPGITARTLAPCYSADLSPASGHLVSAVGCTVVLTVPQLRMGRAVSWEYKAGTDQGVILSYGFDQPPSTSHLYENRTSFNETNLSLQMVLGQNDGRLYRLRSEEESTAWFQLQVVEPLSEPEIVGNSSVNEGEDTKLICNVVKGRADSYWWKKNGKLLLGSDRIQFVGNSTLCIFRVEMSDSGYYTCVVRNAVSQNETSFLLHVYTSSDMLLPMILACVIIGCIAGVIVWCRRLEQPWHPWR